MCEFHLYLLLNVSPIIFKVSVISYQMPKCQDTKIQKCTQAAVFLQKKLTRIEIYF